MIFSRARRNVPSGLARAVGRCELHKPALSIAHKNRNPSSHVRLTPTQVPVACRSPTKNILGHQWKRPLPSTEFLSILLQPPHHPRRRHLAEQPPSQISQDGKQHIMIARPLLERVRARQCGLAEMPPLSPIMRTSVLESRCKMLRTQGTTMSEAQIADSCASME